MRQSLTLGMRVNMRRAITAQATASFSRVGSRAGDARKSSCATRASTVKRASTSDADAVRRQQSQITFVKIHCVEESVDAFIAQTLDNAMNSTREVGNVRFDALRDLDDRSRFTLVEIYSDEASKNEHKITAHYEAWRDACAPMMQSPRSAERYVAVEPNDDGWAYANATSWSPEDEAEMGAASVVHVRCRVVPGSEDAFAALCAENALHSSQEPGNLRFDVFQNADDPERFVLVEVYEDAAAAARHKETAHYLVWRDAVADLMAEPRVAERFEALFPNSFTAWSGGNCEDACEMAW